MNIRVRFFAAHRDVVGQKELELELPEGATVGAAWEALQERYPALRGAGSISFAVNRQYAETSVLLREGDEVALIPPVSGGAGTPAFRITSEPLDPAPLVELVATPEDGAVVTFTGIVRNNFGGRATAYLEYEAYAEMAEPVLARIAAEAQERWAIGRVAVHHRTGRLNIGETAVLIVVAAPHRREAFAAAAYIMDRIKEIAPIWKKEVWADGGSEWVGDEKTRR
ncbi:MAG: molybdenum cofactor biosynthesis protein D/E [Herpetosiphonaceae bacterium]|nr:MAG: molybdenum cofactor biosynthesis protein D/E [Herpetosiphonaceae bacterium]